MLRELQIENFAIIDRLALSFSSGLNILSGETGAGKSILVDSLQLLAGGRASLDQIRTGAEQTVLEAAVELPGNDPLRGDLTAQDLLGPEDEVLVLRRVLSRSGKNRIQANGRLLPLSALQQIGRELVDIHGQHEQRFLLSADYPLDLLDAYGDLGALRQAYDALFRRWRSLQEELGSALELRANRREREAFLKYQIQEVRSVNPQAGEAEALRRERGVLAHSHQLAEQSHSAYQALYEAETSVLSGLSLVRGHLRKIEEMDPGFSETASLCEAAHRQLKEAAGLIRQYRDGIEHNPHRLQEIEERLYQVAKLEEKYGEAADTLQKRLADMERELSSLEGMEERCEALENACRVQGEKAGAKAAELSRERRKTAKRLQSELAGELGPLGLGKSRLLVCAEASKTGLDRRGGDRVHFLWAAQSGEEPRPLNRVASGGELSRIMLAVKSVLAETDRNRILVFDEVDAGVGGAVAEAVGRRLKALARRHQVFCITHLPQIAKMADAHYRVEKVQTGDRTVTRVVRLSASERVQEIARMLGGREITPLTVEHARELLERSVQ